MTITYGSVCSGYCAATLAWKPLGWKPKFFSEIEKFPSAILAHHYGSNMPGKPLAKNGVPNYGDFTQIGADAGPIDLLVGGTPCQSFSVAGKRLGLDDPRGNLALEFLALARRLGARWIVWENVPGVLSSRSDDGTSDFATFLNFVRECGYGFAYRVLDAQYVRVDRYPWAVPQRRRRVFVVGYLGDWRRAAAVLFDRESLRGDPAPRREAGQGIAPTIASRSTGGGGLGTDFDLDGGLIANSGNVGYCLTASAQNSLDAETETLVAHALRGEGFDASEDGTGRGTPLVPVAPLIASTLTRGGESAVKGGYAGRRREDESNLVAFPAELSGTQCASAENISPALSVTHTTAVAFDMRGRDGGAVPEGPHQTANIRAADGGSSRSYVAHAIQAGALRENPDAGPDGVGVQQDVSYMLEARAEVQAVQSAWAVRRLTPTECERLQGVPDGFTKIPWRSKPAESCPDGPRYKALGNSMAVNVMALIGERIDAVERLIREAAE